MDSSCWWGGAPDTVGGRDEGTASSPRTHRIWVDGESRGVFLAGGTARAEARGTEDELSGRQQTGT